MRESMEPRPGQPVQSNRRPYVAPAFESEIVFETMALRCGKTSDEDGGGDPGRRGDSGNRGGSSQGGRGSGNSDRVRPAGLSLRGYRSCRYNRKNS